MIKDFRGEYRWLSNFGYSPITMNDITYPTVEHAYQAAKTDDFKDKMIISALETPGQARRYGQKVELRVDWEECKYRVMKRCIYKKFTEHEHLREKLLATGNRHLMEGNTWGDTYWGVCDGDGENNLGRILMDIRKELRNG